MKNRIGICFILLSLISCSLKESKIAPISLESIPFDVDNVEKQANASFLIDTLNYEIVPLETMQDCLIGEVTNIWLRNDKIIVYDEKSKGIFVFNRDGTYYSRVLAIGQGPGEYPPIINDVVVTQSHICIFPPVAEKIFLYDFNGKFCNTIDLQGGWGNTFFTFDEKNYYLVNMWSESGKGLYHFFRLIPEQGKIEPFHPFDESAIKERRGWGLDNYYSVYNNRALVLLSTIDTIYEINNRNEFRPLYFVDIIKNRIPHKLAEGNAYTTLEKSIANQYITGVVKVMESAKYIFLTMSNRNVLLYNKDKKEVEITGDQFIIPSWGNWRFRLDVQTSIEDGKLLSIIPAHDCMLIKESIESVKFEDKKFEPVYKNVLNQIENEDYNPIVFIMNLKDF